MSPGRRTWGAQLSRLPPTFLSLTCSHRCRPGPCDERQHGRHGPWGGCVASSHSLVVLQTNWLKSMLICGPPRANMSNMRLQLVSCTAIAMNTSRLKVPVSAKS